MKKNISSECIIGNAILQLNGLKKSDIYLYQKRLSKILKDTDYFVEEVMPGDIFNFCEKYSSYVTDTSGTEQIFINNDSEQIMKEKFFDIFPNNIQVAFSINNNHILLMLNNFRVLEYLVILNDNIKDNVKPIINDNLESFIDLTQNEASEILSNSQFKLISQCYDYEITVMLMGLENILHVDIDNISKLSKPPKDLLEKKYLLDYYHDLAFKYSMAKRNSKVLNESNINIGYQKCLTK